MARRKQTIIQRDMRVMEVREDLLERDDTDIRRRSLKGARNVRPLISGVAQARDGLLYRLTAESTARAPVQIVPADGETFGLVLSDTDLTVVNSLGGIEHQEASVPWSSADDLYVVPNREETIIGGPHGVSKLTYVDGVFTFSDWEFDQSFGDELAQPYWSFKKDVTLQPSDVTGTVTLVASEAVFSADYVGLRLRYVFREIEITEFISGSVLRGTVVSDLPKTWQFRVADVTGFRVDDAVTVDTGLEGVIVSINKGSSELTVVATNFEKPTKDDFVTGPRGTTKITNSPSQVSPGATVIWDEPLMSDVRGWPRSAAIAAGRLVFLNFPQVPDGIAVSSARTTSDFLAGTEDDDAIVRQIGDNSPRFLHAINAQDLLLFSDRGCYLVNTRENGILTPSTFNPIKFDKRGASEIAPVEVNDGVVFLESNGETVSAALLDGNVYLKWSVIPLSDLHSHQIKSPVALCGPSLESTAPEKYVFVVNGDGTAAAVAYSRSLADVESVGVSTWDTSGLFKDMSPCFGSYWSIVDRTVGGSTVRMLESFEDGVYVDSAVSNAEISGATILQANGTDMTLNGSPWEVNSAKVNHLIGEDVWVYDARFAYGPITVQPDGTIVENYDVTGERQIGLNFTAEVAPWPAEVIDTYRAGVIKPRCIRFLVAYQNTGLFQVRCNRTTRVVNGYDFGDPINVGPPHRTGTKRIPVFGHRYEPDLAVIKHIPGPFRILYTGQEVQV